MLYTDRIKNLTTCLSRTDMCVDQDGQSANAVEERLDQPVCVAERRGRSIPAAA